MSIIVLTETETLFNNLVGIMFKEKTLNFQVELVKATLERSGYSVTEAARMLGISRSYLTKFMTKNGIKRGFK